MRKSSEGIGLKPRWKRFFTVLAAGVLVCTFGFALAGCSSQPAQEEPVQEGQESTQEADSTPSLEGKTLNIYCGAGMTDPFQEIADAFQQETGCTMNVTYANAAQIQTQISTTEQGDFFIAGSADELKPVQDYVAQQTDLVKHIPVLAVPADNPKNITGLADLANADRVLTGDPEATPIGKIAQSALTKLGLWDQLMDSGVITTTTTAPQISTALANGEGDAGIVWKENVTGDGVSIVDTADLDAFVKTIPSAMLTCASDSAAVQAFSDFLQTDTAWDIWAEYGYERVQ
jgi:molybdate transport system substrate-binding protein